MNTMTEKPDYEVAAEALKTRWDELHLDAAIQASRDSFGAVHVQKDEDGWEHRAFVVLISSPLKPGLMFSLNWKQGTGIKGNPKPWEVLARHCSDGMDAASMTFEDWAENYGYDTDSRKAEALYFDCQTALRHVRNILSSADIEVFANLSSRL